MGNCQQIVQRLRKGCQRFREAGSRPSTNGLRSRTRAVPAQRKRPAIHIGSPAGSFSLNPRHPAQALAAADEPDEAERAPTPAEQAAAIPDPTLTAEELARYEGTYTLSSQGRTLDLRVFAQEGRLMSQATGQEGFRLRSQGNHVFIPDFDDEVRLVFTVENGRATGLTLHQGGQAIPGTRKP